MRSLLITLCVLGILLVGVFTAASQLDEAWRLERSVVIGAAPVDVFASLCNLQTWPQWNVWISDESASRNTTFSGAEKTPARYWGQGAAMRWQQGDTQGRIEVTEFIPGESMEYLRVIGNEHGNSTRMFGRFEVQNAPGGSRVVWRLEGSVGNNAIDKLIMRVYRPRIEQTMQANLQKLKYLVAPQTKTYSDSQG